VFGLFKSNAGDIINQFQAKAFAAWGVNRPSIVEEIRFKAILATYTSIFLSSTQSDRAKVGKLSNTIYSQIIATVKDKKCSVRDIFAISDSVECIDFAPEKFLSSAGIRSLDTTMNGLGLLDNLTQAFGEDCVSFLQGRDGGGMLQAGIMLLRDLTLGDARNSDPISSLVLSEEYMQFLQKIVKAN
jgi:hypothetical protein